MDRTLEDDLCSSLVSSVTDSGETATTAEASPRVPWPSGRTVPLSALPLTPAPASSPCLATTLAPNHLPAHAQSLCLPPPLVPRPLLNDQDDAPPTLQSRGSTGVAHVLTFDQKDLPLLVKFPVSPLNLLQSQPHKASPAQPHPTDPTYAVYCTHPA